MPIHKKVYIKIKNKKHAAGRSEWCINLHTSSAVTHVKYIKLLRNSTEIKKDKKLLEPSEADGVLQYQRTTVSVFLYLCLHLISARKKNARRKKGREGGGGGLRFHSTPRNEITNPIITWMLHRSYANCLSWVIYLIVFPPRFFFNLSLPWWDYSLRQTVYHRKTY